MRGLAFRDDNDPETRAHFLLMTADQLPQTATHTISHHGAPKPTRGNKASAKWTDVFDVQNAEHQKLSVLPKPLAFHPLEFSSARQPAIFGKRKVRSWHYVAQNPYSKSLPGKRHSREDFASDRAELSYGEGDGFTFTFVSVLVSVFVSGAGVSCLLMTVVLLSLFSAGGVTVVDFS
jgi:hypothetical protein